MQKIAMTAAVARASEAPFTLEKVDIEEPRPDEILVRIVGVGVCHTDLTVRDSQMVPLPAVLGHEGSGIVERVGAKVHKVVPGDRVALSFQSCGTCKFCLAGTPSYCLTFGFLNFGGVRADGSKPITKDGQGLSGNFFGQSSFATHALATERNVVKIPEGVPLELMGPLGCGIQTGAGAILRSFDCQPGSSLVVIGGGGVGLSAVMAGALRKLSPLVVVEPHASRRKLALELGATHAIDPKATDNLTEALKAIAPAGLDYAFDTSGRPEAVQAAAAALGVRGQLGLVAVPPDRAGALSLPMMLLVSTGISVRGIVEGDSNPDEFIPELIEHYRAGRFPFDKLVKTYPFDAINQAVADHHHGDVIKAILLMPGA